MSRGFKSAQKLRASSQKGKSGKIAINRIRRSTFGCLLLLRLLGCHLLLLLLLLLLLVLLPRYISAADVKVGAPVLSLAGRDSISRIIYVLFVDIAA